MQMLPRGVLVGSLTSVNFASCGLARRLLNEPPCKKPTGWVLVVCMFYMVLASVNFSCVHATDLKNRRHLVKKSAVWVFWGYWDASC